MEFFIKKENYLCMSDDKERGLGSFNRMRLFYIDMFVFFFSTTPVIIIPSCIPYFL